MSELDEKLSSILNNPQMMQQIMHLAQSMNCLLYTSDAADE